MEKFKIILKSIVQHEDKYLIVKRWYDDRIAEPFQWEFISGILLFGEKPERGAERIVREQAGLEVRSENLFYTWTYVVGDTCNVGICHTCRAFDFDVLFSEELNEYKWVTKEEIFEYLTNEDMIEDIKRTGL